MLSEKIYPKLIPDESGIKFLFNHENTHYTMRFSWKPLFIIEQYYYKLWGTCKDFISLYDKIRDWDISVDPEEEYIVQQAVAKSREFFNILLDISNRGKSPFIIYAQPFDPFKFAR